ncbi:MAG: N-acetylmuramoyl-L-alanine amidase [Bryobacterales bacterium]
MASERYSYARLLLDDLNTVPKVELGEPQYLLVIEAFKKVHRTSPASGYCDDALLEAAHLYRAMIGRFGAKVYQGKSIAAYEFLIHEYPHSKLLGEARQAIAEIKQGVPPPERRELPPASEPEAESLVSTSNEPAAASTEPDSGAGAAPRDGDATADTAENTAVSTAPSSAGAVVNTVDSTSASDPALEGQNAPVAILSSRSLVLPVADLPKSGTQAAKGRLDGVRFWSHPDYTRVVFELDARTEVSYSQLPHPKRLFFDVLDTRLGNSLEQESKFEVGDSFLKRIRVAQFRRNSTRVVFDLDRSVYFDVAWLSNPARLVVEIRERDEPVMLTRATPASQATPSQPAAAPSGSVASEPVAAEHIANAGGLAGKTAPAPSTKPAEQSFARALDHSGRAEAAGDSKADSQAAAASPKQEQATIQTVAKEQPPEIASAPRVEMAKLTPPPPAPAPVPELPAPKAASANAKGQRSLIRALGLKVGRVVIDAGHGGRDPGSIGPTGLQEKVPCLDIAMRLGKLIEEGLGSEVIYTRSDDSYVSPGARPRLANEKKADLFISIHTNSSPSRNVRGIETYYLNFTTDSWALTVASRENAASDRSVHELQDLLSKIALKEKIEESEEFANRIQEALHSGLSEDTKGLRNRGVRKAPLMVLIGAKMPAVLAEIGFISNPQTEKLLRSSAYRQKVANHLYEGMLSYTESLGNISMAAEPSER